MLEEPPLLRILGRGSRNRPSPAQIEAFQGAQTGHVCDALGGDGALDLAIKPLAGVPHTLCGPALTADCGPADILGITAALTEVEPGDIVVQATGGWMGCAAMGDLVAGRAHNAGVAGVVSDGCVRDLPGIQAVGMPVFCVGISPNSPFAKGPGAVGHPVVIGGRQVCSGDMIIGDQDGVVVVPFAQIDAVLAALKTIRAAEAIVEAKVKTGLVTPDALAELVASDVVERT